MVATEVTQRNKEQRMLCCWSEPNSSLTYWLLGLVASCRLLPSFKESRKVLKIGDTELQWQKNLAAAQQTNMIEWHVISLFKWPAWEPCNYGFCKNVSTSLHLHSVTRIGSLHSLPWALAPEKALGVPCTAWISQAVKSKTFSCCHDNAGLLCIVIAVVMLERPKWSSVSSGRRLQEQSSSIRGRLLYLSVHDIMCRFAGAVSRLLASSQLQCRGMLLITPCK